MSDQYAWLIEAAGPRYWNGHGAEMHNFTSDHSLAVRFARREDADAVIYWLLRDISGLLVSREHGWLAPRAALSASQEAPAP